MKPRNINIRLSQEAYEKVAADAEKRDLSLTQYTCKLWKVKPLPMGRPKKEKSLTRTTAAH